MSMKRVLDKALLKPVISLLSLKGGGRQSAAAQGYNKILVIKLAAAGDAILLKAVLEGFKAKHPDTEIHWLASPINLAIARQTKGVSRFWSLTRFGPVQVLSLIRTLRKEQYDAVVDFEQWARGTALIARLSGAPVRVGFDTPGEGRAGAFTSALKKDSADHELFEFFNLMALLGEVDRSVRPVLNETDLGKVQFAEARGAFFPKKTDSLNILIHPGCGGDGLPREWPLESYALLGHWLIKNYKARLFLSAGPDEPEKTRKLKKLLAGQAVDLGGLLSWEGTFSLVNFVDGVISGNTGLMHVAAAFGKKQVALHGPTNPQLWGPLNDQAKVVQSPCEQCPSLKLGFEYHDRTQACMKKLDPAAVKKAFSALFPPPKLGG